MTVILLPPTAKFVAISTTQQRSFRTTWITVTDRDYIVFAVKTCQEAIIALSDIPGITTYHSYIINIGHDNNTASSIRDADTGAVLDTVSTPGILDCKEGHTFWVGWGEGFLAAGSGGRVGSGRFLQYYNVDVYPVNSLAFSTGTMSDGEWEFHAVKGMYVGVLYIRLCSMCLLFREQFYLGCLDTQSNYSEDDN